MDKYIVVVEFDSYEKAVYHCATLKAARAKAIQYPHYDVTIAKVLPFIRVDSKLVKVRS